MILFPHTNNKSDMEEDSGEIRTPDIEMLTKEFDLKRDIAKKYLI